MHRPVSSIALVAGIACLAAWARPAAADVILSPTSVILNTGGNFDPNYVIENTINQSGLSAGFVSGVTDFDAYLAGNPWHTLIAAGNEWFTPLDVTASTIVYDLGAEYSINRLALWNEEFSGIEAMAVSTSNDPTFLIATPQGVFNPVDSTNNQDYFSQVFALAPTSARYVKLEVRGPNIPALGNYVSMGEIAFAVSPGRPTQDVPEPTSMAMLGGVLIAGGTLVLRRRRS